MQGCSAIMFASAKRACQTERNMVAVCQGTKSKNDMIVEAVEQYKDMFVRTRNNFAKVTSVILSHDTSTTKPIRLTLGPHRVFANISSEGMADRPEAEIITVLHHHQAEMAVLVAAAAAAVVVAETTALTMAAEMTGTVDLPPEPEEKAEEAATRRETRGTLLHPNDVAPRPGHADLPPPCRQQQQDRDRIRIAMTVRVSSFLRG